METPKIDDDPNSPRAKIVRAAGQLFARKGLHRTTTKEIARLAGVAEGTIYNYFDHKDDILLAMMAKLMEAQSLEKHLFSSTVRAPEDLLAQALAQRQEFLSENEPLLRATLAEVLVNPPLAERYYRELLVPALNQVEAFLKQKMEAGELRRTNSALLARLLLGIAFGFFLFGIFPGEKPGIQAQDIPEFTASLLIEGLRPEGLA
jgi:AcrR family transcriptional regulator